MEQADDQAQEIAKLRDRLSRLSQASLRINESLDFDTVLQGVLDSACSLTGARYGVITCFSRFRPKQTEFITPQGLEYSRATFLSAKNGPGRRSMAAGVSTPMSFG